MMGKKAYISLFVMLFGFFASAHDPFSARFELHTNHKEGALLHIYLSQVSVHKTLIGVHPQVDFEKVEADQYKEMVVAYLKDHITIHGDGIEMNIGVGAIRLGSHQTELKFHLKNYPDHVERLEVAIDAFGESKRQHSVFWWYTSEKSSRLVLSSVNGFSGKMEHETRSRLDAASSGKLKSKAIGWMAALIGVFGLILCVWGKRWLIKLHAYRVCALPE